MYIWYPVFSCIQHKIYDVLAGRSSDRKNVQRTAKMTETLEDSASPQISVVIKFFFARIIWDA